jgi:hypothetical protein
LAFGAKTFPGHSLRSLENFSPGTLRSLGHTPALHLQCQKAIKTGSFRGAPYRGRVTMTDTAITTTEEPIGALEYLDPATLEIGDNVRDDAALSKEFVASVAENGVLVPITGVRRNDGEATVVVRNCQRRTLAAREAGLSSVPVYVLPFSATDASQETIDRIVHQIVTNDQKHDLTDAQRARGIQQMIDAGMSVTKVAKKLSVHKNTVKAAETAAKSSAAMDILTSGQLSLTEAAAFTEFIVMWTHTGQPRAARPHVVAPGSERGDSPQGVRLSIGRYPIPPHEQVLPQGHVCS